MLNVSSSHFEPISDKSGLFCCYAAQFALSNVLGCGPRPTQDKAHEAARIHHASRRRGSQQAEMCEGFAPLGSVPLTDSGAGVPFTC